MEPITNFLFFFLIKKKKKKKNLFFIFLLLLFFFFLRWSEFRGDLVSVTEWLSHLSYWSFLELT